MLLATLLLALLLSDGAQAEDPAADAQAFMQGAGELIGLVASSETLTPDAKRALVEDVVESSLDLPFMTRAALGPRAQSFSPDELLDFAQEYERHLLNVYLRWTARRTGEKAEPLSATYDDATGVARIELQGELRDRIFSYPRRAKTPGVETWQLRRRNGEWRILSLSIDGVDVTRSFREQFASVLEKSTPAEVVAELRRRNAEAEARNPFS